MCKCKDFSEGINLTIEARVIIGIGLALYLDMYPYTSKTVESIMKKIISPEIQLVLEKVGPPQRQSL